MDWLGVEAAWVLLWGCTSYRGFLAREDSRWLQLDAGCVLSGYRSGLGSDL